MGCMSTLRVLVVSCATLVCSGCPGDDPIDPPPTADAGSGNGVQDAGSTATDGGIAARIVQPSTALTAGGGTGENANYKVRLLIGGPTAAGVGSNESNSVKVGASAAQNGQ